MKRYCLTLKLRQDPKLVAEYIEYHRTGWPAVHQSIRAAGVLDMQLYELDGSVFMIMDCADDFSFERKAQMDRDNQTVQEWERLMERFQDVGPDADVSAKWRLMRKIFELA